MSEFVIVIAHANHSGIFVELNDWIITTRVQMKAVMVDTGLERS